MAIQLPDLSKKNCKYLVVCGDLITKEKSLVKWLKKESRKLYRAKYGSSGGWGVVMARFGGGENEIDVHLDITSKDFLVEPISKVKGKLADLEEALDHVIGQRIAAGVDGYFVVKDSDLPEMIKRAQIRSESDGVGIRTASGSFAVSGAPIHVIDWHAKESTSDILVHMAAQKTITIGESYLEDALELMETAFSAFIKKANPNA